MSWKVEDSHTPPYPSKRFVWSLSWMFLAIRVDKLNYCSKHNKMLKHGKRTSLIVQLKYIFHCSIYSLNLSKIMIFINSLFDIFKVLFQFHSGDFLTASNTKKVLKTHFYSVLPRLDRPMGPFNLKYTHN